MQVSVAGLFLAGILPAILIALALMIITYILCKKNSYGSTEPFVGVRRLCISGIKAFPALFIPVLILGGILGGYFSPTGASAVAAVYALLFGFTSRMLKLSDLPSIFMKVSKNSAMILFLIGSAQVFAWLVAYANLVTAVTQVFLGVTENPILFLLIVNILLLLVGAFFDMSFAIIVLAPLLAPVAEALGIHPIHFALVVCFNLCVGLVTPGYGLCLFAICGIDKELSYTRLCIATMPFIAALLVTLLIVTYFDFFTLALPRYFGYA
jgi:tripartite ATP-independent transporter DctM subunit